MNYAKLWILLQEDLESKIAEASLRKQAFECRYLSTRDEKFQMLAFCANDKRDAYQEVLDLMKRREIQDGEDD